MRIQRVLFLNNLPKLDSLSKMTFATIANREDLEEFYSRYLFLEVPVDLFVDCKSLNIRLIPKLLKFIEEYRGGMVVLAQDPVVLPFLSRFEIIEKDPGELPDCGNILSLRLSQLTGKQKNKIESLFGLQSEE